VRVAVRGWLALPFVVEGTDMVAIVPERLARRFAGTELVRVPPPFGPVDLVEGYWFQPTDQAEPGLHWLLELLAGCGAELDVTR